MDILGMHGKRKSRAEFERRLICKQRVAGSNPLVGSRFWPAPPRATREKSSCELPQRALVDQGGDKPGGPSTLRRAPAVSGLPSPARQDPRDGGTTRAEDGLQQDKLLLGSR